MKLLKFNRPPDRVYGIEFNIAIPWHLNDNGCATVKVLYLAKAVWTGETKTTFVTAILESCEEMEIFIEEFQRNVFRVPRMMSVMHVIGKCPEF